MIRLTLAAALLAVLAPLAQADEHAIPCNHTGSQIELNRCAADAFASADAELNATWRAVLAQHGDDALTRANLVTAQRLWVQLRDADLDALFPLPAGEDYRVYYGSMYPMSRFDVKTALTQARTTYLRERFLEPQGDY